MSVHPTRSRLVDPLDAYIIDFLALCVMKTLRPPPGPPTLHSLCSTALARALGWLAPISYVPMATTDPGKPAYDIIKHQPDFINDVVSFTLSVTSESQIQALQERITPCRCNFSHRFIRQLHKPGDQAALASSFQIISRSLFFFVIFLSKVTSTSLYRSMDSGRSRRDKALKEASYYMLDGAQAAVDAAACWYQDLPSRNPVIAGFMVSCLNQHRAFLPCISSPSGQQLLSAVSSELRRDVLDIQNGVSIGVYLVDCLKYHVDLVEVFSRRTQQSLSNDILELIHSIPLLFFDVFENLAPSDRKTLVDGDVASTMADVGILTMRPQVVVDPETNKKYVDIGAGMMKVINNSQWIQVFHKPIGDLSYYRAWTMLYYCFRTSGRRCFYLGCQNVPRGKHFPRCAGCRATSYCSKECQKLAWFNGSSEWEGILPNGSRRAMTMPPHKTVCKDWAKLLQVWPMRKPNDEDLMAYGGFARWNETLKILAAPLEMSENILRSVARDRADAVDGLLPSGEACLEGE